MKTQVFETVDGMTARRLALIGEAVKTLSWYIRATRVQDRVVVKVEDGTVVEAVPAHRTDVEPEVVFVREDGWSLGCRYRDRVATFRAWAETWVAVVDLRDGNAYRLEG